MLSLAWLALGFTALAAGLRFGRRRKAAWTYRDEAYLRLMETGRWRR